MIEQLDNLEPTEIDAGIGRVMLRELTPADAQRYFDLIDFNRDHFRRTGEVETLRKYQTVEDVRNSLDPNRPWKHQEDERYRFGIWAEDVMVGSINYRPSGPEHSKAVLGYWVGAEYVGHGYAASAVRTLLPYLRERGFLVAEALVRDDNEASQKTLRNADFNKSSERVDRYITFLSQLNISELDKTL